MKLKQLFDNVFRSAPKDWYISGWRVPDGHHGQAIFIEDPAVSIAWGSECPGLVLASWSTSAPHRATCPFYVSIYLDGLEIYRQVLASVDDDCCYLPVPEREGTEVSTQNARLAWLVTSIDRGDTHGSGAFSILYNAVVAVT